MNKHEELTAEYVQFVRRGVVIRTPMAHVNFVQQHQNYLILTMRDGSEAMIRLPMKVFVEISPLFLRIQNRWAVRASLIKEIDRRQKVDSKAFVYVLTLTTGHELPVGRSYFTKVRKFAPHDKVKTK
jgi:DNA-binding LytR/AlgR family response regulator